MGARSALARGVDRHRSRRIRIRGKTPGFEGRRGCSRNRPSFRIVVRDFTLDVLPGADPAEQCDRYRAHPGGPVTKRSRERCEKVTRPPKSKFDSRPRRIRGTSQPRANGLRHACARSGTRVRPSRTACRRRDPPRRRRPSPLECPSTRFPSAAQTVDIRVTPREIGDRPRRRTVGTATIRTARVIVATHRRTE